MIESGDVMKRKIAPIVIVVLMSIYILGYVVVLITGMLSEVPTAVSILLGVLAIMMVIAVVALIYTLSERLKEIDKEDKDDLSKY
jgi:uncharacterized membrane protein